MCNEGHIKILPPCFRESAAAAAAHRLGVQMSMEIRGALLITSMHVNLTS